MPALIDQASRGNLKAVRDLIDTGTNVDAQDKQKHTALMLASKKVIWKLSRLWLMQELLLIYRAMKGLMEGIQL